MSLLRGLSRTRVLLLGLAVGHMLAHSGVVPAELKTSGVVLAVLGGGVGMSALATLELDDNAIAFFAGHVILTKIRINLVYCNNNVRSWQTQFPTHPHTLVIGDMVYCRVYILNTQRLVR